MVVSSPIETPASIVGRGRVTDGHAGEHVPLEDPRPRRRLHARQVGARVDAQADRLVVGQVRHHP